MNVRSNAPSLFSTYMWRILQSIYTVHVMFYRVLVGENINILSYVSIFLIYKEIEMRGSGGKVIYEEGLPNI
jgi:hypothetical protein